MRQGRVVVTSVQNSCVLPTIIANRTPWDAEPRKPPWPPCLLRALRVILACLLAGEAAPRTIGVLNTAAPHPVVGRAPAADLSQAAVKTPELGRILPFRRSFETNSNALRLWRINYLAMIPFKRRQGKQVLTQISADARGCTQIRMG